MTPGKLIISNLNGLRRFFADILFVKKNKLNLYYHLQINLK